MRLSKSLFFFFLDEQSNCYVIKCLKDGFICDVSGVCVHGASDSFISLNTVLMHLSPLLMHPLQFSSIDNL